MLHTISKTNHRTCKLPWFMVHLVLSVRTQKSSPYVIILCQTSDLLITKAMCVNILQPRTYLFVLSYLQFISFLYPFPLVEEGKPEGFS